MEGGVNSELSKYRYERAVEDLNMAMAMIEKAGTGLRSIAHITLFSMV